MEEHVPTLKIISMHEYKKLKTTFKKVKKDKLPYLPTPSARAGYDTRSIFKRSLTGLNSKFSFS